MNYPNKLFIGFYNNSDGDLHVVLAHGDSKETVVKYVRDKTGVTIDPQLVPGAVYQTIYEQNGKKPEKVQAKILLHIKTKLFLNS